MQEKKLYIIAMIGALSCFTGDILLGFFTPAPDFMNKYIGICFSYEWAEADPVRFAIAGFFRSSSLRLLL